MTREKVIDGLRHCSTPKCYQCPYDGQAVCMAILAADALDLLAAPTAPGERVWPMPWRLQIAAMMLDRNSLPKYGGNSEERKIACSVALLVADALLAAAQKEVCGPVTVTSQPPPEPPDNPDAIFTPAPKCATCGDTGRIPLLVDAKPDKDGAFDVLDMGRTIPCPICGEGL